MLGGSKAGGGEEMSEGSGDITVGPSAQGKRASAP